MTLLEFVQEARRDFITAGPERHFSCPAGHATGIYGDSLCVMAHAVLTTTRRLGIRSFDAPVIAFEEAWKNANDKAYPTDTNERGFAACVAAYDQLLLHLNPAQTTHNQTPQEIPA